MVRYVIRRLGMVILVMLGVLTMVFLLSVITPGDPVENLLGSEATDELREAKRAELGLDKPLIARYFNYVKEVPHRAGAETAHGRCRQQWQRPESGE